MLQIELTIKAEPALMSLLSALGANLETVALAIDSSMRIRQHEANQAETAEKVVEALKAAPVSLPPAAVVPFPQAPAPAQQTFAAQPPMAPVAAAPAYSHDQIAVAGAGLMDLGPEKQQALLALLARFGVQAITQLPKEALGAFATELRALGARI